MGYSLQRHSPLKQINKENVRHLVPAWSYSLDDNRSEELQPIVYQGVIYLTTHNATMAIEAKTGHQIWKSKVDYPPETPRIVCCGIINRGAAIYDGKLFRTTLDANVIALDTKTGQELWRSNAADIKDGYSMTVAPLVADGVVLTGVSGAEYGTRDFIDRWIRILASICGGRTPSPLRASPAATPGRAIPGSMAVGPPGSLVRFDPELHTVYWGVGNPDPFNAGVRKGDNLYTCSVLALDPKTGTLKWHYQFSPNNPSDYDAVAEMVLGNRQSERQADQGDPERQPQRILLRARSHERQADRRQPLCPGELGIRDRHEDRSAD